jgi:diaminopimelate epimerase
MRSARWHAQQNVYLVTEDPLTPDLVRAFVGDADGFVEVLSADRERVEIVIWNPDGSQAEMSGNGTRIAARWLAARSGAGAVVVRIGDREVRARMLEPPFVEQQLGPVVVGPEEEVAGIALVTVDVGNPHAVVAGDPADLPVVGPLLERHPRFPQRTNVQVARRIDDSTIEARVWERGVGETGSSGSSAVAVAAAFGATLATVRFPGGPLEVRFDGATAYLTGPAEPVQV